MNQKSRFNSTTPSRYRALARISVIIAVLLAAAVPPVSAQSNHTIIGAALQGNLPERYLNDEIPRYNDKNGGFGVSVFTGRTISDELLWLLTAEFAVVTEDYQTDNIGVFEIASLVPSLVYHPIAGRISPFTALGLGLFHVLYHEPTLSVGIRPGIGVTLFGRLSLSLEYTEILSDIEVDPLVRGDFDNYYIAVKVGIGSRL